MKISLLIYTLLLILISSCWMNTTDDSITNSSPYPVIALDDSYDYSEDSGTHTIQLYIQMQEGLKDPEGDTVFFRSSTLPSWITLNKNTGLISVDTEDSHTSNNYSFWSEDEHGADTHDTPCSIEIFVD
ncbi:MAG: hypothetical protein K9L66_13145 [Spirochaetaceae bacterium]|nr:hypothetical protein [Spirochaetaceae bacterium]